MKSKTTFEQRKEWQLQEKCWVCGSEVEGHSHPTWMWLANPPPVGEQIVPRIASDAIYDK